MYKKITHTIFEEQFAQPELTKPTKAMFGAKAKMTDNTLVNTLRRQVRDILIHYDQRMRDAMIAIVNGTEDRSLAVQYATTEINNLSEIFGRYYTVTNSAIFVREFNIIASTTVEMALAQKNNEDMTVFAEQNAAAIIAFAELSSSVMNGMWYKDDIIAVFTELTNNYVGQVRARMASNWSTDFRLSAKNATYLVSGSPILTSYSDAFTSAIALSFPQQF